MGSECTTVKPLISVLMPVFNAEMYVVQAIESIINQDYENFELLIIDDASDDDSFSIISGIEDSRVRIFQNDRNKGYLTSVNYLFSQCRGDYITFQDADDWSEPNRLSNQELAFRKDSKLMFCGTQCIYTKNGREQRRSMFPLEHDDVVQQLESGDTAILCGASVMIKHQLLNEFGGFRVFFDRVGAEHLDWFWQMMINNRYMNLSEPLYTYRATDNSFSRKLDLNPLRYHCTQIALLAYWQKKLNGKDALDEESTQLSLKHSIEKKYESDSSLIYRQAGVTQLAFGEYRAYVDCLKNSIRCKGVTIANVKFMFIWFPLFIFLMFCPRTLQRKVVKRNNLNFLKDQGVDVNAVTLGSHHE